MTTQERRDMFAAAALQALIAKAPFVDDKGEYGLAITTEKSQEFKQGIVESAFHYADWMLYVDAKRTENDNAE